MTKRYGERVAVALVFPNGVRALGVGVVTGERWDGATTITLPSQFVNVTADGQIVQKWSEAVGKEPENEPTQTMAIAALDMCVRKPLEAWAEDDPLPAPRRGSSMFGPETKKRSKAATK